VRKHGLPSPAAFNALSILGGAGGALSPSEIAERMIVSRPTMTGILQSLESRGLVRIVPHPRDRRSVHVEIAPAGQARVDALRPELHRVEKRWMSCLTQSEKQAFLGLLAKLQRHPPEVE
jgi:DNA-binding MarR family transcriptional regulator